MRMIGLILILGSLAGAACNQGGSSPHPFTGTNKTEDAAVMAGDEVLETGDTSGGETQPGGNASTLPPPPESAYQIIEVTIDPTMLEERRLILPYLNDPQKWSLVGRRRNSEGMETWRFIKRGRDNPNQIEPIPRDRDRERVVFPREPDPDQE